MTNFNYSDNAKEFFGNPEAFTKTPGFEKMVMGDIRGYESPIRMIASEIETKMENDTLTAIQRYGIDVDKEELIKNVWEIIATAEAFLHDKGFELQELIDAMSFEKLSLLKKAANLLCDTIETRKSFCTFATSLLNLWKYLDREDITKDMRKKKDALEAIAQKAFEKGTGARGLRSIIEDIMVNIMFEIPSHPDIEKCIVTKETVLGESPKLIRRKTSAKNG